MGIKLLIGFMFWDDKVKTQLSTLRVLNVQLLLGAIPGKGLSGKKIFKFGQGCL